MLATVAYYLEWQHIDGDEYTGQVIKPALADYARAWLRCTRYRQRETVVRGDIGRLIAFISRL